ncbi:hypothetical protein ACFQPA_05395 [Halomarina halobia]|uniref:Lipoprotein n=1 Tax=Halomarina halobia TaxID=3033386 RepID=A0ABD6A5J0_9EURY|nr:hypothetical protein [Halomarina sp. PSR21]
MNRRTVLGALTGGVTAALAGCLGGDDADGDANGTNDSNGTGGSNGTNGTNTTNGTDGGASSITGEQFQAQSANCGTEDQSASVSFPRDGQVKVKGVITGADQCHSARLGDVSVEGGTLTVSVETYVPEEMANRTCGDCVVDIEYQASFAFDGTAPERVVVTHDGERVATGER